MTVHKKAATPVKSLPMCFQEIQFLLKEWKNLHGWGSRYDLIEVLFKYFFLHSFLHFNHTFKDKYFKCASVLTTSVSELSAFDVNTSM